MSKKKKAKWSLPERSGAQEPYPHFIPPINHLYSVSCIFEVSLYISVLNCFPWTKFSVWFAFSGSTQILCLIHIASREAASEVLAWYFGHNPQGNGLDLHGDVVHFLPQLLQPL